MHGEERRRKQRRRVQRAAVQEHGTTDTRIAMDLDPSPDRDGICEDALNVPREELEESLCLASGCVLGGDNVPSSAAAHATAPAISFGIPRNNEMTKFSTSGRNPQNPPVSRWTSAKSKAL